MATGNIQYVYDHMRLFRSALRPVNNGFFVTKEQQMETTKKFI